MNEKFKASYGLLRKAMEGTNNRILWTAEEVDEMSYVECRQIEGKGIVIFQVLKDGHGFVEYMTFTKTERMAWKLLSTVKSLTRSMKAHPDCTEGSEFADFVALGEEIIEETTGVKP